MQENFKSDNEFNQFIKSLSKPRFAKYLQQANNDVGTAIDLYFWNARLSQSLYSYVQAWEVCLRNKISDFLTWKYGPDWPFKENARRNFKGNDRVKILETIQRLKNEKQSEKIETANIIAGLTAGFWVSQLNYKAQYAWSYNLNRVFANNKTLNSEDAHAKCSKILLIRNRIAHHEAIYHLNLSEIRMDMSEIVAAMCAPTHKYAETSCTFYQTSADAPLGAHHQINHKPL
jgi:hypothetical protein